MTLSEELIWRGFVNQTTFKDMRELDAAPRSFYLGVDPSADSMQIGNLAVAMMLKVFIKHGWKPVLLIGGATGLIGDPDGKKQERDLKSVEQIESNKAAIAAQYTTLFDAQDFTLVDNYDWFKDLGYLDFLRTVGKHVPMRQMLGRDFVQSRLSETGEGISYAEFSYSLIQGYDFYVLNRDHDVTVQMSGADQWGNCIAGVDLTRRLSGNEVHVYTMPLVINKTTGIKFGKSENGAIWLDANKTSPYDFYQFWLNVDDAGVEDYLKIYTSLEPEDIARVMQEFSNNRGGRAAQRALAHDITKLVHGDQAASDVLRVNQLLFGGPTLEAADYEIIGKVFPTTVLPADTPLLQAIVVLGLARSNTEARRFVTDGAVVINGETVTLEKQIIDRDDFKRGILIARRGKNSLAVARQG
jgi:tyrosyl-tRNA synthetase